MNSTITTHRKAHTATPNRTGWKGTKKTYRKKTIKKLTKCSDEHFISQVVITVKSDQFVKIALDSKILNDAIHKNKYKMQNIDHLMEKIVRKISELKQPKEHFISARLI